MEAQTNLVLGNGRLARKFVFVFFWANVFLGQGLRAVLKGEALVVLSRQTTRDCN